MPWEIFETSKFFSSSSSSVLVTPNRAKVLNESLLLLSATRLILVPRLSSPLSLRQQRPPPAVPWSSSLPCSRGFQTSAFVSIAPEHFRIEWTIRFHLRFFFSISVPFCFHRSLTPSLAMLY